MVYRIQCRGTVMQVMQDSIKMLILKAVLACCSLEGGGHLLVGVESCSSLRQLLSECCR